MSMNRNESAANEADKVLLKAVLRNDVAALQKAIRTGADANAVHRGGSTTPLKEACNRRAKDEIVRILLDAGADPRWTPEQYGTSPAAEACYSGHLSIVEILIDHDNSLLKLEDKILRGSLLFTAICGSNVEVVRFLIHRGADVLKTNKNGLTPLLSACQIANVEIVRLLLAAGAVMEANAHSSRTALHHAVLHGKIEVMRELIFHHNANMFAVNSSRQTPFDMARSDTIHWVSEPLPDTIDPLLQMYGIKMTHEHGRLALHAILSAAEDSYIIFQPPLEHLFVIRLPLGDLQLQHFRTLLHSLNTDLIRARDESGKLPIHTACRTKAPVKVLALMFELDPATLRMADHSGALPLHESCRGVVDFSTVQYLVEQGGVDTLAARTRDHDLPLHYVCGSTNPSLQLVKYLIESFPAAVASRTDSGQYPFMIAACDKSSASLSVVYELFRARPDWLVPRM